MAPQDPEVGQLVGRRVMSFAHSDSRSPRGQQAESTALTPACQYDGGQRLFTTPYSSRSHDAVKGAISGAVSPIKLPQSRANGAQIVAHSVEHDEGTPLTQTADLQQAEVTLSAISIKRCWQLLDGPAASDKASEHSGPSKPNTHEHQNRSTSADSKHVPPF